jgi:drug/metabolite transporter (DMT)-like permease
MNKNGAAHGVAPLCIEPMSQEPVPRAVGAMSNPYLLLTLCSFFWGANVLAGKAAVGNIDPYALMVLRWTGALLLVLPFAIAPLWRDWAAIRRRWWLFLFYGTLGFATFNALCYVAAYYTTGFNIGLDQVTINIFVMLISFVLFRTRVRLLQLVGVAFTIAGVALTASHGDFGRILALDINFGDLLVLLACLGYAVYSVCLRWRPRTDWRTFIAATSFGAILASLVFAATFGGGLPRLAASIPQITPLGWSIAVFTMIFPSIISQMLYVRGVELIGANRASLFINLIPLFGAVGAVLVLGEKLEAYHLIAGALVIAGIVLAEWSARRT